MPGFLTHLLFGEQSISFINSIEAESLISRHSTCFALGLQGPDFFFYNLPAYIFYKRNIGNVMHEDRIMLFFESLFNARHTFEDEHSRRICDAYILGFMGHYSLDITCHPYIYFKSSISHNQKRNKIYDFGRHLSLETDIDYLMLQKYRGLVPSQFDYAAAVTPSNNEKKVISRLLYMAISNTYPDYKVRYKTIIHSINSFIKLNHYMNDPTGKKKKRIRKLEQVLFKCAFVSSIFPSDTIIKFKDPCNDAKITWHNPWNPSFERNDSIFDLINIAMPEFLKRIDLYMKSCGYETFSDSKRDSLTETNEILHYRNQLLASLSDISYVTGLPLS
ncbi:MAG: zinc dependent phospholipase C family protein [Pseudobutyrivibrio sp.]|nr:zinc dependent phospholipase C family protein [Pseudobutyrivibrio sp.]